MPAVSFQQHGALVVLQQDGLFESLPLGMEKFACPEEHGHTIIGRHQLHLGRAPSVNFLLVRTGDGHS